MYKSVFAFLVSGVGVPVNEAGSQEINHRFWGNPSPILPPALGKNWLCFRERLTRF